MYAAPGVSQGLVSGGRGGILHGMGHEIVYCFRCQNRILGTEIEKGKAFPFGNRFCCKACV